MGQKKTAEFRFYEKPVGEPVLALMGKDWVRDFGDEIPCLHFHNLMEIGRCVQGEGKIVLGNEIYDYSGDVFTLIPQNILHGTSSEGACYWEYLFFDMEELMEEFDQDPVLIPKLFEGDTSLENLICVGSALCR